MKIRLLLTVAIGVMGGALLAAFVLSPAPAFAGPGDILTNVDNPHNFSVTDTATVDVSSDVPRKCDFCHTPHGASQTVGVGDSLPLWNRNDTVAVFIPYDDPQGTIQAGDIDATLGPQSMACMSCHDGSLAIDDLVNFPNPHPADADIVIDAETGGKIVGEMLAAGNGLIGNDLTNDHPVGFTNPGQPADMGLVAAFDAAHHFGGGNDQIECASCHNPHLHNTGTDQEPFLRTTMADSALCAVCHIK